VLCLKAMHKDAQERYKSVEALIRDIDHYLGGEPLEARPDTLRYRTSKFVRRNRTAVIAASFLAVLVVGLVLFFTIRLTRARNTALAEAARAARIQRFMLDLFQGEDKDAGPAEDLRVVTVIDRGVLETRSLSTEPEVQADLYQTLGTMYHKLGKLDRADALLQSSLKERRSRAPTNNDATADNLIALGLLRSDQGQSKEAERLVREALAIINPRDLRDKTLLAKADSALGYVLVNSGEYGRAVAILDQAVSLQTNDGAPSPELAETLGELADAHLYLGYYSVSDSLNQRALAIDRDVYGDSDPHVSDDLGNLGQIQEMWGHYADAERYNRQALQISQAWYGQDHPDTARKMATLAETLIYEDRYQEADSLLQQALATQQRVYGKSNARVARVLNLLGSVANKRADFNEAEADFRSTIEIYRSAYGDGDYRVAVAMANLASVYFKEKQYARAEPIFRDVLQRFTKALSADNINTAIAQIKLGRTLLSERRYQEAEEHTRTGYETLMKQASPSTSFIQGAQQDLVTIYEALKRPQEAQKFRGELASANLQNANIASRK
jgi:serine/threonine-protein kinase